MSTAGLHLLIFFSAALLQYVEFTGNNFTATITLFEVYLQIQM